VRPVDDQFYLVDVIREVDGRKLAERERIRVAWNELSPGYFTTVQTPILLGRDFDFSDTGSGTTVAIVNESLARRAFQGQNPIGHRLGPATIVGVVKDSHYNGVREQPRPVLYRPLFQDGSQQSFKWGFVSFEMRSDSVRVSDARRIVASVDRNLPVFRANTLRAQTAESLLKERLLAALSGFFGALALLVSCVGLYGLMAYTVARRTAEIGIRMALGARRDHITWLIAREALWLTLAGIAAGIPLALAAARYAKSMLFEISVYDPPSLVLAVTTLLGIAALAGYIPTRRAVRVDPMAALRCD
jgi:predicted permease